MKKKIIPIIVALVLIILVAVIGFGGKILDKYTYGKEWADLDEYFGVEEGELAILLQNDITSHKAVIKDDYVYFDYDTVREILNEGFYVDRNENKLLYTTADDTKTVLFGEKGEAILWSMKHVTARARLFTWRRNMYYCIPTMRMKDLTGIYRWIPNGDRSRQWRLQKTLSCVSEEGLRA